MMQLPALDPQERAYLQARLPDAPTHTFAFRLRQRLIANLGVPVEVIESTASVVQGLPDRDEPVIEIETGLAASWLNTRLGGRSGVTGAPLKDAMLIESFKRLIRRTLAESVFNSGALAWPQAMHLVVAMGGRQGAVDIFWNSAHAMAWARRTMGEKA